MNEVRCRALIVCGALVLVLVAGPVAAEWAKGVEAYNRKDYAAAVAEFEEVTRTNAGFAGAYYMLGLAQNSLGQRSQAMASLRKAVELEGDNASYRLALGHALLKADQFAEAYTTLQPLNLTAMDSKYRSDYALVFAQVATKTNRFDEAIRVLSTQAQSDTRNARLHQALGVTYNAQGDDKKAFASFKKSFELDPTDDASGRSAVTSGIAAARRAASDQEKVSTYAAAAQLAERLAGGADTFEHSLLAGEAWLGAKDYEKALSWFGRAQAKQPQNALVHFYKGQCLAQQNRLDAAVTELQQSLKIGAQGKLRKQIYESLGYVYDKQKDFDRAIAAYQDAGNSSRVSELQGKKDATAQNRAADVERQQYIAKIAELETKIAELEKLGASEEAKALRDQIEQMRKALQGPS